MKIKKVRLRALIAIGLSLGLVVLAACGNQVSPFGFQPFLSGTSGNVKTPLPVGLASPTIPAIPQPPIPTLTATPAPALSPTPSPTPKLPQSLLHFTTIHMLSLSQGWAAGTMIAPGEENPVQPFIGDIYRTTDGGVQWEKASPDKVPPGSFSAIYFLDPQNAWIAANPAGDSSTDASPTSLLVYHTSNGGRSWQSSSLISILDGSPKSIIFANPDQGWLLVSLGESVNREAVEILGTSDGGLHWNTVSLTGELPSQSTAGSLPFACIKNGMAFLDKDTGWIAGDCPVGIPFLYMTKDGGKTWQAQALPVPAALPANVFTNCQCDASPPKFNTPQFGYLTVQMNIPNTEAYLYVTNDGGSSWLPFKLPVLQPQGASLFVDSQHGWITDGSQLYATQDGGQSWTFISQLPAMNIIGSLDFVDIEDGWLTNGSQIFVTHDGGQNWVTISPSVASLPLPASLERINFPAGILSYTFRTNLTRDVPQGYTLRLLTGQKMYVTKNGDATIEVVDPQNNLLTDASSLPGPWSVAPAQTGDYTLVLSGQGLVSVTITLPPISGDQTFPLPKGDALQSIGIPQGVLFYQFSATLSQGIPLGYLIHLSSGQKMSLSGSGEMTAAIFDPGNSIVEPDSSQVNHWQITASQSGDYTIVLMGRGTSFIAVNLTSP